MANFLVLGKSVEERYKPFANGYRGVQRMYINYPSEFHGTEHNILLINARYEKKTYACPYVEDINFAMEVMTAYNEVYPYENREIVEVIFDDNLKSNYSNDLLGFDIANVMDSFILERILFEKFYSQKNEFTESLTNLRKRIIENLNENRLFRTFDESLYFLTLYSNLFELHNQKLVIDKYSIQKIYLIPHSL